MVDQFCGRRLDPLTMTYKTSDGSGQPYPVEMAQEVTEQCDGAFASGLRALSTLFCWQERIERATAAAPSIPQDGQKSEGA